MAKTKLAKTKTIKIQKFKHLANKPAQPKKGISYAVEKAENIDAKTGKKTKGDIFKKYKNGVLNRQIFVTKSTVKKLVQKSIKKMKKKTGGLTKKNKKKQKTRIVYVQAPAPVGDKAQEQAPAPVVIQNGTGLVQAAKQGVGTGAGLVVGTAIGNAVVGMFSSDE
jgi:hypothetical protein